MFEVGLIMFKVKKKCCGQCLFGKNKIVSDDRKDQLLEECKQTDSHFICHEGTIAREDICCKAFYDKHDTGLMRAAQRLSMVEFVD